MSMKKILIAIAIIAVAGAGIAANVWWKETDAPEVQVEAAAYRDLTATVTGSGAIQPAREVDISSNVMGRVTRLAVEEGDAVQAGDFLLQVDPQRLESAVAQMEASLQSAKTQAELAQQDLEYQQELLDRREGLYRQDLLSRELYLEAQQNVTRAQRTLEMRDQEVQRIQAQLDQSRYDLTQVVFEAPMDGIITKLNIDEGENVVTGTMNNPGTVLLTIADLSVVELEIEVDETDIVYVELGQEAVVRIDAFPDDEFHAVVTEVGKSPISTAANQAINFKVVVTLTETVPGARPGLSGTADITTATREHALSVPIQALILREVKLDEDGEIIREVNPLDSDDITAALEPEQQEAETVEKEGAFVVRDGRALFTPIRIGIAGERHFEVLDGVEEGDQIIIGPFEVIRTLLDGEAVTVQEEDSGAGERTVSEG
jgi:HlyD family secretion protein